MFRISTMNKIAPIGLDLFRSDSYEVASDLSNPDAILVRSADLHDLEFHSTVKAIARAGAGVNNIPLAKCSEQGIVVFNTPGANANAVKELAIAGLLLSSRKIIAGVNWGISIKERGDEVPELVEKEKSKFQGPELSGKTLAVIGLGAIGVMVANDALALGMKVIGFDPFISVDAAWNLSHQVQKGESLEGALMKADYISLHVPLNEATKGMINEEKINMMKKGVRIINLARGGLVREPDIIKALNSGRVSSYFSDFPTQELLDCPNAICLPHLGASTPEAEDNCAVMAAKQLKDYLENGNITNSVNFPKCHLDRRSPYRLIVINRNVPNMVGQITTLLAKEAVNITAMINHHKDEFAYNIIDSDQEITATTLEQIEKIAGVIRVRCL